MIQSGQKRICLSVLSEFRTDFRTDKNVNHDIDLSERDTSFQNGQIRKFPLLSGLISEWTKTYIYIHSVLSALNRHGQALPRQGAMLRPP